MKLLNLDYMGVNVIETIKWFIVILDEDIMEEDAIH